MMLKNEKTKKMNYKNADNIAENKIFLKKAGPGGFEPPAFGLEARRYILAKPRAQDDFMN